MSAVYIYGCMVAVVVLVTVAVQAAIWVIIAAAIVATLAVPWFVLGAAWFVNRRWAKEVLDLAKQMREARRER